MWCSHIHNVLCFYEPRYTNTSTLCLLVINRGDIDVKEATYGLAGSLGFIKPGATFCLFTMTFRYTTSMYLNWTNSKTESPSQPTLVVMKSFQRTMKYGSILRGVCVLGGGGGSWNSWNASSNSSWMYSLWYGWWIPGDTRSQFINSHGINLVSPDYLGFSTWWVKLVQLWLTHWGRVTHVCVSKLTIIGSDNGLSPGRRQAIIWTNAGILLIRTLGTNFSEILVEIHSFWFSKIHLKMASAKWRLFGLGLNELKETSMQKYG